MSASLVGSEMCIRDRTCCPPHPRGSGRRSCYTAGDYVQYVEQLLIRQEAVSYTHLTLPTICSV
eukprot:5125720-Alexandrium_andersonii.AAC.1